MSDPLRVFVCEDDPRMRAHLVRTLGQAPGFMVVGEAPTAELALAALVPGAADVLLLDLELPGMDGIALVGRLPPPPAGPEVLILTTYADADKVFEAIRQGAAGYLVKGVEGARLAEALREVASGGTIIEPRLARRFWNLLEASRGRAPGGSLGLTGEEIDVLTLVARGLTNPEVGETLGTSRRKVKSHLESIYRKLGVSGRVEAVLKANAAGLITL